MLNIHILFEELSEFHPEKINAAGIEMDIIGVRALYDSCNCSDYSKRYVYVVNDHSVDMLPSGLDELNIIYIGIKKSKAFLSKMVWQSIHIKYEDMQESYVTFCRVFEKIQSVFEKYTQWNQKLLSLLAVDEPMEEVLKYGAACIMNPLAVFDNSMTLITTTDNLPDNIQGTIWEEITNKGYTNVDELPEHMHIDEKLQSNKLPFLFKSKTLDSEYTHLVTALFNGNRRIGLIASTSIVEPFTQGQLSLVGKLKEIIQIALIKDKQYSAISEGIAYYVDRLLQGLDIDHDIVSYYLKQLGWQMYDNYCLLFFKKRGNTALDGLARQQYKARFERLLKDVYIEPYENGLLAIVHNFENIRHDRHFQTNLESILSKSDMICGMSIEFNDYMNIKYAFIQAKAAIKEKYILSDQSIYYFTARYVEHVMSALSESTSAKSLCHPQIIKMFMSEGEHGKDFVYSLYWYLINGRNITAAAKQLHIHRNTLIYRIDRISQLLDIDINTVDDNTLFMLLLSCLMTQKI